MEIDSQRDSQCYSGYHSTEVLEADASRCSPRCCRYHPRKFPLNKAVLALLVVSTLERYAFYNVTSSAFRIAESYSQLHIRHYTILTETILNSVPFLLYPFVGYLADVRFGRLNVITSGVLICAICYCLLALIFSLGYASVWRGVSMAVLFTILFVVLCAGSAAVQVNMVPFLADQVRGAWGEELSSLFHWYYWTRNIGTVAVVIQLVLGCSQHWNDSGHDSDERVAYVTLTLSAMALGLASCLLFCCKQWLHHQKEIKNPLSLVVKVIGFARKAKYDPHQSAFTINKDPPPRLDLAKLRYGGPFTSTQVEDVKTFYRLLLILFSMIGILMLITAVSSPVAIVYSIYGIFIGNNYSAVVF